VAFVTGGRDAKTIGEFAQFLSEHKGKAKQIACVSIDMSQAFINGVTKYLPDARITFDKYHVVAHASKALDQTRRGEQKTDPKLKGLRWALLKDRGRLTESQRADLDAFTAQVTTKRTARAWLYREQLRDILDRKQINVVSAMLKRWCTNVKRSKVEAMKKVAQMILDHFDGVTAWAQTRQTNGFLEAINGLFQAAKRKARGYGRFQTMRTAVYLVAGNLNFSTVNLHAKA
jgi:transposase